MKRHMDLVRTLLLEIESCPPDAVYDTAACSIPGYDHETIDAHLRLLDQAGFLQGFTETLSDAHCTGLTWQGYEFLDAARSDRVWSAAKARLLKHGTTATVGVLKDLLVATLKEQLGLAGS